VERSVPRRVALESNTPAAPEGTMAPADLDVLVNDIFDDLSRADLHMKPYMPEDRDAEAAKIARLRQLRMAKCAGPSKPPLRLIVTQ
jgi:hypothetical protein